MKKVLLVLLLTLSVLFSGFSSSKWGDDSFLAVGLSSGFSQSVFFPSSINDHLIVDNMVPIKLDLMRYVGSSFAVHSAVGVNIFIPGEETPLGFGFLSDLILYYRIRPTERFDILLGLGAAYQYIVLEVQTTYGATDCVINLAAIVGSIRLQYEVADNWVLFAEADAGYNLNNNIKYDFKGDMKGWSLKRHLDMHIMPWTVNVGVSYNFKNGFLFWK